MLEVLSAIREVTRWLGELGRLGLVSLLEAQLALVCSVSSELMCMFLPMTMTFEGMGEREQV